MGGARSIVFVDLDAVAKNVRIVRESLNDGTMILAVIKKNAYGHGLERVARTVLDAGVDRLGVADVAEVARLRSGGIKGGIHVLGPPLPEETDQCVLNDVILTVPDRSIAEAADAAAKRSGKKLKCHMVIDTGMGRLGPRPSEAIDLARAVASMGGLDLEGVFTHFPNADEPARCMRQYQAFMDCVASIRAAGIDVPVLHASACGTIFSMPQTHLNMVRPGLCLLGAYNYCGMKESVNLHPAMKVTTRIVFIKTVPEGTPISYSGTYVTKRTTRIATVSFGYGDGYDFRLSNRGWMSVCGKRAPVLGRVTMDYTMLDITDIPDACVGADAVVLGSPGPDAEEIAKLASTVPHEVLCALGQHAPRF